MKAAELLAGESDQWLLALQSKGIEASLRCTRVITSGRAQLKAGLQHAFARLRAEADLLRDRRAAELEAAEAVALQSFEDALRTLPDHYVSDKVLGPFDSTRATLGLPSMRRFGPCLGAGPARQRQRAALATGPGRGRPL